MTSCHGQFQLFGLVEWKLLSLPGCNAVSLLQLYSNPGSFRIGAAAWASVKEKLMMFKPLPFSAMHPFLHIIGPNSVTWPQTAAREAGSFWWTQEKTWECWWTQSKELVHGAEVALIPSVLWGPFIISCREETSQWFYSGCLSFLDVNHASWHFFFLVCLFLKKISLFSYQC